jgi:hypothetical protein
VSDDVRERIGGNPFFVLGLRVECSRAELEREGQKLLAMIELGIADACIYRSPLGQHPRSAEDVRAALAELRDPDRRALHELWARNVHDVDRGSGPTNRGAQLDPLRPFPALTRLGWRRFADGSAAESES